MACLTQDRGHPEGEGGEGNLRSNYVLEKQKDNKELPCP